MVTATFGNATASAAIEEFRIFTFCRCHGKNDGLNAFKGIFFKFSTLQRLTHAWNHSGQVFDVPHFFNLLNLLHEVVEVKFVFGQLPFEALGFVFIILFLGSFHQRNDVAHTKDSVGHTFGIEHIKGIHFFANPNKFDGFVHHRLNRQRSTTAGIAIEFGEHHPIKIKPVVEGFGSVYSILPGHGIHNK